MKMPDDLPPEIEQWLHFLSTQSLSRNTIAAYRRGILHFTDWYVHLYEASFHASEVMPRDVRDWKSHQQTTERSAPAPINQRLAAVNAFLGLLVYPLKSSDSENLHQDQAASSEQ